MCENDKHLLLCPFCGGKVKWEETRATSEGPGSIYFRCTKCFVSFYKLGGKKHCWSDPSDEQYKKDVIIQWNTRMTLVDTKEIDNGK